MSGPRLSRRQLLLSSGLAALAAACGGATVPARGPLRESELASVLGRALDAAKRAGASYADARIVRRRGESVWTREDHVSGVDASESYGVGVRVLAGGAWGFSSSSNVTEADAAEAAQRAVAMARANAAVLRVPVALAPAETFKDAWATRVERDPFEVPLEERIALLLGAWGEARKVPGVKYCSGFVRALGEWKVLASTEGSLIEQSITRVESGYDVTAVDATTGEFVTRAHQHPPRQAGWEHVTRGALVQSARQVAEEAVEKLRSPSVEAGARDLVLAPSNLWLTIHESVGHPTELDRMLGYEANFAGTSFAKLEQLGKLRYASDLVTIYADKTTPGGLATCGYDDEGVRTQRWDLVKDGTLVGLQTTRDLAAAAGEARSRGTCYAQDHRSFPFQRMPNVSLAPGKSAAKLADLIAATDDGVLVTGRGSWSIDHQRYNFQFGGQTFHEIKKGRITHALKDVAYQSNSLDFWASCDMLGDAASWELHGAMDDGKGEPVQSNPVGHGCPPARFRKVNVINTNARGRA